MTDTPAPIPASRPEQTFPALTPALVERIAAHGRRRATQRGEILFEAGDQVVPFFVITAGQIEFVRPSGTTEAMGAGALGYPRPCVTAHYSEINAEIGRASCRERV